MDHHSKIQGALNHLQGRLRYWIAGVVLTMGVASPITAIANQQLCQAVFPEAVQSHKADGEITFDWNAQLLGNTDNSLAVARVNNASWSPLPSCGGAACIASGVPTEAINISVNGGNSNVDHQVGYQGNLTLGNAQQKSFRTINVGSSGQLNFSSISGDYQIKKLQLGYDSTLNLAPGTYWINDLILSSETKINVSGSGTARLYVKGNVQFPYKAYVNMQAAGQPRSASRLLIYSQGNIDLQTDAEVSAIVYAKERLSLSQAKLYGAASFHQATIGTSSKVTYQSQAIPGASWGAFCVATAQTPSSSTSSQSSSSSSSVNACRDVFSNGLQTHNATGKIEFKYNAQMRNGASPILNTQSIKTNSGSNKPSCDTAQCTASGLASPKFKNLSFINSTSSTPVDIPWSSSGIIGADGIVNYGKIRINTSATLTFSAQEAGYKIKELALDYNAVAKLPAGDYWIETLKLDSDSHIQVIGTGTVRLFVKNALTLNWMASINKNTADASKAIIYTYGDVSLKTSSQITGLVYSLGKGSLDYTALITGALSASNIVLDTESLVAYRSDAVNLANYGLICDEDEPQPDLVPPELTLNVIPQETELHEITLSGTVTDPVQQGSGVASVIIKLASGVQRTAVLTGNNYSVILPLAAGNNLITVEARDFSGNLATRATSIKRISLPVLEIVSPADNSVTTQPNTKIMAKVTTAWPLEQVSVSVNDLVQVLSTNANGYYEFETNDLALVLGTNEFNIKAATPDGTVARIIHVIFAKPDRDGDGRPDDEDRFPDDPTEWSDLDNDGIGDNSDADRDGDGYTNEHEVAVGTDPNDPASKPTDMDNDGIPDELDEDRDGDGRNNDQDAFPNDPDEWSDLDNDGIGDNTDADRDGDGYSNEQEIAEGSDPNDASSKPADIDNDGIPDSSDPDRDGDGRNNDVDAFPNDSSEWSDLDADGIGDNSDTDRDGDGYANDLELEEGTDPNDAASKPADMDNDGIPDSKDSDRDGDDHNNDQDAFPNDPTEWSDLDSDGVGDNADTDRDGDGYSNDVELEEGTNPNDAASKPADMDNDGIPDSKDPDRDGDSHNNDQDAFPNDPTEWSDLDTDGIGDNTDTDRDGDGYSNDVEIQEGTDPDNAMSKPIDSDNDGIPDSQDADRDGDGHNNDADAFPDDASEWSDIDGDSIGDNADEDRDGDGINNDYETQAGTDPNDASSTPDDSDNDGIPDVLDTDRDGDGYNNDQDAFPNDPTEWSDLDTDGIGDNADTDRDGDGFSNDLEQQKGTNPADASDYPDTVSPLVQITNPANPQIEAATYLLQGTVSDPVQPYSGIANVSVTNNRYENAPVVAVVEGSSFTATVPLALGANTLTVRARDLSGNASEAQHQVQRIALPHFSNILPVTGSVITEKTVTVSGQVQTAMPLEQVRFYLNEWQITPSGTSQPDIYTFSLPGIPLQLGSNTFILRAETPDGAEQQSLVLVHNPENPDAIKAPEISLIAPLNNTQLRDSSFTLKGRVTSYAGAVNVTVNGHAAIVRVSGGDTYYFEDLLAFSAGQEQLPVVIEATDALNKRTQFNANYFLDNTGPQIQLAGLSPSPTVNPVAQSPANILGVVSDSNLASVTVNDAPIRVSPTAVTGQYAFALPLTLAPGAEASWAIAAFDRSGNKTQVEYIFKSSAQASIDPLLPAAAADFIGNIEPLSIQVAARVGGLVSTNKVIASIGSASVELAIAGTLASGNISVPPTAGAYVLNYQVLNENQEVIASTSRNFTVRNEQDIPVQLLRHEPENNEDLVEPNQPIELYFNKPIDTTKLEVKVYETLHGKTYLNLDPAGLDFINAKGYQLMDVHRDRELVTGGISVLPDGKIIAFYPSRQFGFSGTLYVDIKYNSEELTHFTFKVRKLPTFVIGGIADQFGQPLSGITVTLPELGRTTITNNDGGFAFGFQEPAGKEIPGGRYKLNINPDFATQGYGTQVRSINLQEGYKNEIPIIRLTELHPSIPFQLVSSHQAEASFVGDALRFDFSEARLLFDGRTSGQLQYQFFQYDQLGTAVAPGAWPQWMYAGQPRGVEVEGKVGITMNIPQRDGSYDYIPGVIRYVFIMGYNPEREVIEPVGIGEITNHQVVSVGKVALKTLDFVGYAWVHPDFQVRMEAVANGQVPLQQLISELQQ